MGKKPIQCHQIACNYNLLPSPKRHKVGQDLNIIQIKTPRGGEISWTSKKSLIYKFFFKKVDFKYCKIITFEIKERVFFAPCKTGSTNFESSWFKTFALHKVGAFDIILEN